MRLNELIVDRIYEKTTGASRRFVRVIYKDIQKNVLLVEFSAVPGFPTQSTTRSVVTAIPSANGQLWNSEYEPYIPQVTKFVAIVQYNNGFVRTVEKLYDSEDFALIDLQPSSFFKVLTIKEVKFDDPNYRIM